MNTEHTSNPVPNNPEPHSTNYPPTTKSHRTGWLSRRKFLIGTGAGVLVVGICGNYALNYVRHHVMDFAEESPTVSAPDEPFLWFTVKPDNTIIFHIPKVEMGQGIHTALAQIAAEELCADWNTMQVEQATTKHGYDSSMMFTFGSMSVASLYKPLREAAAVVRETLRIEAARRLRVKPEQLEAQDSMMMIHANGHDHKQRISYGDIVAGKQGAWKLASKAPLKGEGAFTFIGKSIPRVDLREKLTGRAVYGYDARANNMLFGAIARPPRFGAVLKHAEAGEAATMPGVVKVVIQRNTSGFGEGLIAGVVAETRSKAHAALEKLVLRWEGGTEVSQKDLDTMVTVPKDRRKEPGIYIQSTQSTHDHFTGGNAHHYTIVSGEYRTPFAAHAHLEPQAALADVRPDAVHVHVSTQAPDLVTMLVANAIDRKKADITVHPTYLGGGFGRRIGHDVAVEAAVLSAAVGRPVHVGWTRTEEFRHGYYRQPTHHVLRGALNAEGRLVALEHHIASGDVLLAAAEPVGGFAGRLLADTFGIDPGAMTGAAPLLYAIEHHHIVSHRIKLPILTSAWRGLGLLPNTFARESFMDELARAANKDPIDFRIEHLTEDQTGKRLKAVLERVRRIGRWDETLAEGHARGVACCTHAKTLIAQVAEVSFFKGQFKVHRVDVAVDPGFAVNPDGAAAQIQGAITMGLSSVLFENLRFAKGLADHANFDSYPLLTLKEAPEVNVDVMSSGSEPFGMGEVGIGPIAAAVGNALAALTGKRMRSIPFDVSALG